MEASSQPAEAHPTPETPGDVHRTRLAPSPTGALHLGNARTFLVNWALARQRGWRVLLRVEDLNTPRTKDWAARQAIDDLAWLGIDWDEGPVYQADDLGPYTSAMHRLASEALAYPCDLSRKEIEEAADAPHAPAPSARSPRRESRFPPELRPALSARRFDEPHRGWRFVVPSGEVVFSDECAGPVRASPVQTVGDFIVWTRERQPAYQLAVVVDDARQGITHVVRGDDLLDSAARQLLLYRALGLSPEPRYAHLPLVLGPDGRRLAKRHGDTRLSAYRDAGVPPERVIALLARWSGVPADAALDAGGFAERFGLSSMPPDPARFTPEDHRWLLDA